MGFELDMFVNLDMQYAVELNTDKNSCPACISKYYEIIFIIITETG